MEKPDEMLIEEIKNGQPQSFDNLMQRYQYKVYHIAFGFAKSSEGAMDISQNVFLKIYENLGQFRGESQFKTWLTRISYNEGRNWIKKNQKHLSSENLDIIAEKIESDASQEDDLLAKENKTRLLRCLYGLNTKYRLAVILRYFEDYSIKDIANALNCSEGVVKNMLFRSVQKLKAHLNVQTFGENK